MYECVRMYVLILAHHAAQVKDDYMNLVAAACVLVASKQGERPSQVPTDQQLESVTGLQVPALPCPALPCPALPCPALPCPACCLPRTALRSYAGLKCELYSIACWCCVTHSNM